MTDDIFDRPEANMPPPGPPIPGHLAFTADQLRAELAATPSAELEQLIEQAESIHRAYLRERGRAKGKLGQGQPDALLLGGFRPGGVGTIGNQGGGFGPGGLGFGPGGSTGVAMPGGAGAHWGGMRGLPAADAMGAGGAGAGRAGTIGMGGLVSVGHGAKGQGDGDEERTSKYLLGDEPNEIFGADEPTAPPVIGE